MRITCTRPLLVCVLLPAFLAISAAAGERAFLNMETIFEGYYKTVRANAVFEQRKKDFEDRLDLLREELRGMIDETKKLENEATDELRSDNAREDSRRKLQLRLERLRAKDEEFRQFRSAGMNELQKNRLAAEEELIADLTNFVRSFCRERGFTMVYDITGKSLNRMPVLLVYPEEEEITTDVLVALNQGHEEELARAKAELEAMENAREQNRRHSQAADGAGN